jgi:hypothetical protein
MSFLKNISIVATVLSFFMINGGAIFLHASAETVSGNGYILNQVISPIQDSVSGNGYTLQQAGQVSAGILLGSGYQAQGVFGVPVTPTAPPPIISGGGGGGSGGGYYVLPFPPATTTVMTVSPRVTTKTILTYNGSTCSSRIALSGPVDLGLKNDPTDVKKLETFLDTYEGEKLPIDDKYDMSDFLAVKKWQLKYKNNILTPMRLKKPTGTVYTSSMRQIERQTTATCGQQVVVHSCPYFKTYTKYGDVGPEVKKIQQFLNIVQGEKLAITGKYDSKTVAAAKRFQRSYRKDIVSIVTLSFISGNWNVSTRTKANEVIGCDKLK